LLKRLKTKPSLKLRQQNLRQRKLRLRRIWKSITLRLRLKRRQPKQLMMKHWPSKRHLTRLCWSLRELHKKQIGNREFKKRLLLSLSMRLMRKSREKLFKMPSEMSGVQAQQDFLKSNLQPILSNKQSPLFQAPSKKLWLLMYWSTSNLFAGQCTRTKIKSKTFTT
jgi:hypothetical protein